MPPVSGGLGGHSQLRPHGRYALAGYSFGGLVALRWIAGSARNEDDGLAARTRLSRDGLGATPLTPSHALTRRFLVGPHVEKYAEVSRAR